MKDLLLLGTGQAHVHLLSMLASKPPVDVRVSLISPHPHQFCAGMLPDYVAGHHALEDCLIQLGPLLKCVRYLARRTAALDVQAGTIRLDDGSTFGFDWLSIDTGPTQERQQIEALLPGAREHGLFVHPLQAFCALWPRVTELGAARPLRFAVLGGGLTGIELALAIRMRLPGSSVTLVEADPMLASIYPTPVQAKAIKALKQRAITLLSDLAVGIQADQVLLKSGARLACDVPVIASGLQAPAWLEGSGLTLDAQGFAATDAMQRCVSHPHVFAAPAVDTRFNHALAKNLLAALAGSQARERKPQMTSLNFLNLGDRRALASWGRFSAQGRWAWWLKNWVEQRPVRC